MQASPAGAEDPSVRPKAGAVSPASPRLSSAVRSRYDQWGVEPGKRPVGTVLGELEGKPAARHDSATAGLIARCRDA